MGAGGRFVAIENILIGQIHMHIGYVAAAADADAMTILVGNDRIKVEAAIGPLIIGVTDA